MSTAKYGEDIRTAYEEQMYKNWGHDEWDCYYAVTVYGVKDKYGNCINYDAFKTCSVYAF